MIAVLLAFNFLFMIILPIMLARKIAVRYRVSWGLFGIGAVAFILSQVGHLPFNWLILQRSGWFDGSSLLVLSIFLGLSAGIFEGVARYLTFRFWAREARSWGQGLMVGMGHGGVVWSELVLGILSCASLGIIFWLRLPEPRDVTLPPLPGLRPLAPLEVSGDSLERSKYSS